MRRDVMHFFNADVKTVYQAYLTAAQNPPFSRTCEQKPYYSFQFGLNFSMKYNMNGGSCTLHFMPYGSGTAVDLRFSIAQLGGGRYAAYDRDLTDQVIDILRVPAQPLKINVEEFLNANRWVTADSAPVPDIQEVKPPVVQPEPEEIKPPVVLPEPEGDEVSGWQPAPEISDQSSVVPPVMSDKTCTRCASQLLRGARFCTTRGTPVPVVRVCSACGKDLLPGAKFCTVCGHKQ